MKPLRIPAAGPGRARPQAQFDSLDATALFCPKCQRAMPVRTRPALYLASGVLYHYDCAGCGELLGKKNTGEA